ncbi:MAG TPA: UPF0182 family protein [Candidatus Binatia bacterium]|nr:UPF0182 family protein [Candidatus Binatia bacterium]
MSAFGFDPDQVFRRRRPRVVGPPRSYRRWRIALIVIAVIVVLLVVLSILMGLRVNYLFLSSLGHSNVFWTPLVTQAVLFVIGLVLTGGLVFASVPFWARAARAMDVTAGRITFWVGVAIAVLAGIGGGAHLAGSWQDVLLFLHGHAFGATDPVFGMDYGFYVFTLPVIDSFSALLWAGAIIGLLGAGLLAAGSLAVITAPQEIDIQLHPAEGKSADDALRISTMHIGAALVGIFVLAALGAHFGVYHLTTDSHSQYSFVGLDATELNVIRPVLGALQVIALVFAVATILLLVLRRSRRPGWGTPAILGGMLFGWLILAGLVQGIPAAVYTATGVNPNAEQAQAQSIDNYLSASRYAWGLETSQSSDPSADVVNEPFNTVTTPSLSGDLAKDPGTLANIRIQDPTQLPAVLNQIDKSRSYQGYDPNITIDRYPNSSGQETEVMIGVREIAEGDIPNSNFVNNSFVYTHGYGITAVSVNQVGPEGEPNILDGKQPMQQVDPSAPPALDFDAGKGDPSIYCGEQTTQPVVVNTNQLEFDYPSTPDSYSHAGAGMAGFKISNPFDKLAVSLTQFGGLNLFLSDIPNGQSVVLMNRTIDQRIETIAPFLTVDQDPYIVVDPQTGHLMWIADAYVETGSFPESDNVGGISYMRNAVKAVVDARTCQVTLYAVDVNEPLTAAWNAIYPGLLHPLSQMPSFLVQHLRYPEDLFSNQLQVYAQVHVDDNLPVSNPQVAADFFAKNDFYSVSQNLNPDGSTSTAPPQYVELTLPGSTAPQFVLMDTFSPYQSGSGSQAQNMTAWLAAESDYTQTNHPQLIAVPLGNNTNVRGPYQFDNNSNTDPTISEQRTLVGQAGSQVVLGNVIVLPFNDDSFLYVRPFYVLPNNTSVTQFPQLRFVIVGTQNSVALGTSLSTAVSTLYNVSASALPSALGPTSTTPSSPSPTPSPTPSASPTATPAASPGAAYTPQELAIIRDLVTQEANLKAAYASGNLSAAGQAQAAIDADISQLQALLEAGGVSLPTPTPAVSPSPSASP